MHFVWRMHLQTYHGHLWKNINGVQNISLVKVKVERAASFREV